MGDKGGFTAKVLTSRQKAAIVVRYLLAEGSELDLTTLPTSAQAMLAQEMAVMSLIDRETRDSVIAEFCEQLDSVGLSFPGSIDGALTLLDGHLSDATTGRLRRMAALSGISDPWERIAALAPPTLAELARIEAPEIAAVMFSNIPVQRAAEVFRLINPDLARQIAYAMSLTDGIDDAARRHIGLALVRAADALPQPVLDGGPVEKVGAILNFSQSAMRDSVLEGLNDDDASFAESVRKTIFTWANIPERIDPRDVARIVRRVEGPAMIRALAGATGKDAPTAEFILGAISSRLADSMRDEIEELGSISPEDAEEAMSSVVAMIRQMETEGEIILLAAPANKSNDKEVADAPARQMTSPFRSGVAGLCGIA